MPWMIQRRQYHKERCQQAQVPDFPFPGRHYRRMEPGYNFEARPEQPEPEQAWQLQRGAMASDSDYAG